MKLSVMITTYNLENYIDQTLESVMNQKTDFDFEVLVGDDGSSDKTADLVKIWKNKYPEKVSLFVMDRDPSVTYNRIERASKNRINLLKHAKGEYLIFLDGDDWYIDETKLQKQVDYLDSHPEVVVTAHDVLIYYSDEDNHRMLGNMNREFTVDSKFYWSSCMYLHSDTIMFRNCIDRELYDNPLFAKSYDDNIIMYALLKHGKIHYSPEVMACYRQLQNSSWNAVSEMEKALINMADFDLERQLAKLDNTKNKAKKYKYASRLRHIRELFLVITQFDEITLEEKKKYKKLARENKYTTLLRILKTNNTGRLVALASAVPFLLTELILVILKRIKYY